MLNVFPAVVFQAALLAWDNMKQQRILEATALLFPVRDGKFHVFHKTIVDWLTGEITDGSSVKDVGPHCTLESHLGGDANYGGTLVHGSRMDAGPNDSLSTRPWEDEDTSAHSNTIQQCEAES